MRQFMILCGACAVLTVLALRSETVKAESIEAVLDKAEQALGGAEVLAGIETARIRSHGLWQMPARSIPPTPYQVELVYQRPDRYRLTWKFPEEMGGTFVFGYDGKDAWGMFGGPAARCKGWHREVVQQMAAEVQIFLVAPARAASDDAFRLVADESAENPVWVKLEWRPFSADKPWGVWFDRASGDLMMLEHESYQMDGQIALARIKRSEPKNFAGLNYPTQIKFEALRDGKVIEAAEETIDEVELNPELPANFFACPPPNFDAASIGTKDVPAETVVKFEHRGPYHDVGKSLEPGMDVIMAAGLIPMGAASGTYLSDPNTVAPQDIRTELAIRVAQMTEEPPVLPRGYELTTQPARRVAYAYHRGDHAAEGEAHERLRAWMAERGIQPAGPPRGIWFHDPEVTVTDDLMTEVQIPIKGVD